jgi:hypothetical protein
MLKPVISFLFAQEFVCRRISLPSGDSDGRSEPQESDFGRLDTDSRGTLWASPTLDRESASKYSYLDWPSRR